MILAVGDGGCIFLLPRRRGGIGRRAGLKIRYPLKMCRFEPDRRYVFFFSMQCALFCTRFGNFGSVCSSWQMVPPKRLVRVENNDSLQVPRRCSPPGKNEGIDRSPGQSLFAGICQPAKPADTKGYKESTGLGEGSVPASEVEAGSATVWQEASASASPWALRVVLGSAWGLPEPRRRR